MQALVEAGAKPLPAGCGPCIGLGTGLLEAGETGISATNRNFKGRMGSREAKAYLGSPEVVAASALSGTLSGPGWYEQPAEWNGVEKGEGDGIREEDRMITPEQAFEKVLGQLDSIIEDGENKFFNQEEEPSAPARVTEVHPDLPEKISGEIVFCDMDNISTDGIYPGKYTYMDNVPVEKMAEVCMSNYDEEFSSIARENDILVGGGNFGTGSSREQAATCLLAKGIKLVIAESLGNIFSRNSINNALMGLEVPHLVERLRETFVSQGDKVLTRRTGWTLTWDVGGSRIEVQEGPNGEKWSQAVGELSPNVQDIIATGGLEKWVKKEISNSS